jgi:hypothetical protein
MIAAPGGIADVRPLDVLHRIVERILPWYDPAEAQQRRAETERVRRRSIAARLAIEATRDVPKRYERFDGVVRR